VNSSVFCRFIFRIHTFSRGTVLPPSKISSSCRSAQLYVNFFVVVTSAHILWTKQAQSNQWPQGLFMLSIRCHFPSNTKYSVLILYARDGQPVRDQQPHFYCVIAKSHIIHVGTHEHHPISSSLKHVPLLTTLIVNITHQHDKDRNLRAIYCYACYLVGLLVVT